MQRKYSFAISVLLIHLLLLLPISNYKVHAIGSKEISTDSNLNKSSKSYVIKELTDARTMYSKSFELSDGTIQTELSQIPIHYEDIDGNFHEIDTSIMPKTELATSNIVASIDTKYQISSIIEADKNFNSSKLPQSSKTSKQEDVSFLSPQVPFNVSLPENIISGYSIEKESEKVSFIPINANHSIGTINEKESNKIVYPNVWNNTDVELVVTPFGIKENIILQSPNAPDYFEFQFAHDGQKDDSSEENYLSILPSWLVDANGEIRDVEATIIKKNDIDVIRVEWDDEGLSYPIIIDPVTTLGVPYARYVDKQKPNNSYSFELTTKAGGASHRYYSFYEFNIKSSIPSNTTIHSANLYLYAESMEDQQYSNNQLVYAREKLGSPLPTSLTYSTMPTLRAYQGVSTTYGSTSNKVDVKINDYNVLDVTNLAQNSLSKEKLSLIVGYDLFDGASNYPTINFTTPWQGDASKQPKLVIVHGYDNQPNIIFTSLNKNDDNSVTINWKLNKGLNRDQLYYEFYSMKKLPASYDREYFQTESVVRIQGDPSSYTTGVLSEGNWVFALRSYNGLTWTDWSYTNSVSVTYAADVEYIYNSKNELVKMASADGRLTQFNYDPNGNLLGKQVVGKSSKLMIPDGNPTEWLSNRFISFDYFEDGYNDFLNSSTIEPERDIRSVYYYKDQDFLYIMLELGRISGYQILNPHGFNNDNYFIYLPTTLNLGSSNSRNGTPLGITAEYEIASWHPDDVTVHRFSNSSWQWNWTGNPLNDGLSSKYRLKVHYQQSLTTSAVLELKIPLVQIPNANTQKMVVVSASDNADADIAKK